MAEVIFNGKYTEAVGRRKRAIARVRMYPGKGQIIINERAMEAFFGTAKLRETVRQALKTVGRPESFDISIYVVGGGTTGQAEAIRMGIARCLLKEDADIKTTLKKDGLLTRDSRRRERKKPGKLSARRSPQWSKR